MTFFSSATVSATLSASTCEMSIGVLHSACDLLAAFEAARGQMDLLEDVAVHRALLRDDRTRRARADDEYVVQRPLPDFEQPATPAK